MNSRGHFIAQFHLRNFKVDRNEVQSRVGSKARKTPHVWSWSPSTSVSTLVPVKESAQQTDLYYQPPENSDDPSDEDYTDARLEAALSKVENMVSPHFERLRRRGSRLDANSLAYIIEYMMIQFCRTPARLEAVTSSMARAMASALRASVQREKFVPELIPFTLYARDSVEGSTDRHSAVNEYVGLQKRSCWGMTLRSVESMTPWFEKASWDVLSAPPGTSYVIGDDPVVMLNPADPSGLHDGLAYDCTEITMPVSPQVALCGRVFPQGTYLRFRNATLPEVESLNARQLYRARDAVFSKSRYMPTAPSRKEIYRPTTL
jgi:hypothetical protein